MAITETLEIRLAEFNDAVAMFELHQSAMLSPWSLTQWQSVFGDRYSVLKAIIGDKIVACAVFHIVIDELELQTIAVHPDYHARGIGRQLLDFGIQTLDMARKVFLEVDASNDRAVALYQSSGFHHTATRKAYYAKSLGNGDALLMTKTIKETL